MPKLLFVVVCALLLILPLYMAHDEMFHAILDGQQAGKSNNFKGALQLILNVEERTIKYFLVHNVTDANDAHIHQGAASQTGVKLLLFPSFMSPVNGTTSTSTSTYQTLIDKLHEAGQQTYVYIHADNTNHEIRGQIGLFTPPQVSTNTPQSSTGKGSITSASTSIPMISMLVLLFTFLTALL